MRVNFSEHISCQICIAKGTNCNCPPTMEKRQPVRPFAQPTNWKSWASAMIYSRSSSASKITLHFSKLTSKGTISGSKVIYFSQSGEIGVGPSSPTGNRLIKMFMQKSNMMLSHPTTDDPVRYVDDNHRRVEQPLQLTDSSSRSPFVLLQDMSGHHDSSYKQSQNHLQYQSASEIPSQSAANAPQYSDSDFLVENCPPHRSYKSSISAALLSDDNRSTVLTTPPLPPYVSSESTPSSSLEPCVTNYCSLQQESVTRSACLPGPVKPSPPIAKPTVKKVAKPRDKAITCECGLTFNHRGHYNEHRKCVHDKIKQHKCAFVNCQRFVFFPSIFNVFMFSYVMLIFFILYPFISCAVNSLKSRTEIVI